LLFFIRLSLPYHIQDSATALLKTSSGSIHAVGLVHQILSKSNNIFNGIWQFNDFQNGGRPPCWILKTCSFLSCGVCRHDVLLPHTKFRRNRTIRSMSYDQKSEFQDGCRHLEFQKFHFMVT